MSVNSASKIYIHEISDRTPFPQFSTPEILGSFSLDAHRNYIEGPVHLKFCQKFEGKKAVRFDLDKDCRPVSPEEEEANSKETSELVQLLRWINLHKDIFVARRPHFVFYRGLMTKILGTPYEDKEGWTIAAIYRNGTIYIRNIETPESLSRRADYNANPRLKRISEWGFHFEHFLLSDEPYGRPNPAEQEKNECNVVYLSKLNDHRILYAAELDAVWVGDGNAVNPKTHPEQLPNCKLVELKTTRFFQRGEMTHNFKRFNLRKWWCQSFPARICDILVGFRDDEGVVRELEVMPLRSLSKMGEGWAGTVCFNFMDQFLTQVKKTVKEDEEAVYVFEFIPASKRNGGCEIIAYREIDSDKNLPNLI